MAPTRDPGAIAVIGGGIVGTATAAALARCGADVVLVTEAGLASGASGRSLSWLNSFFLHPPDYHRLRMAGMERYRELAGTHDAAGYLRFDGGVYWPGPGRPGIDRLAAHLHACGYPVERLSREEAAARGLGLNPDALPHGGVLHAPQEGWVDLPTLVGVLADELVRVGGRLRTHAGRASIEVHDDRVVAVTLGDGERIDVGAAVLATGADVPRAAARLGTPLGDGSTVSVLVRTAPVDVGLRAVVNAPRIAVRPGSHGGLVLDHDWATEHVVRRRDGTYSVPDATIARLLEEASAVLDGTPDLTLDSYGVGAKPVPADGRPVVGELDGVSGCFVAFTHSGATLGLVLGDLLAREVLGERSRLLEPFRPGRPTAR